MIIICNSSNFSNPRSCVLLSLSWLRLSGRNSCASTKASSVACAPTRERAVAQHDFHDGEETRVDFYLSIKNQLSFICVPKTVIQQVKTDSDHCFFYLLFSTLDELEPVHLSHGIHRRLPEFV